MTNNVGIYFALLSFRYIKLRDSFSKLTVEGSVGLPLPAEHQLEHSMMGVKQRKIEFLSGVSLAKQLLYGAGG